MKYLTFFSLLIISVSSSFSQWGDIQLGGCPADVCGLISSAIILSAHDIKLVLAYSRVSVSWYRTFGLSFLLGNENPQTFSPHFLKLIVDYHLPYLKSYSKIPLNLLHIFSSFGSTRARDRVLINIMNSPIAPKKAKKYILKNFVSLSQPANSDKTRLQDILSENATFSQLNDDQLLYFVKSNIFSDIKPQDICLPKFKRLFDIHFQEKDAYYEFWRQPSDVPRQLSDAVYSLGSNLYCEESKIEHIVYILFGMNKFSNFDVTDYCKRMVVKLIQKSMEKEIDFLSIFCEFNLSESSKFTQIIETAQSLHITNDPRFGQFMALFQVKEMRAGVEIFSYLGKSCVDLLPGSEEMSDYDLMEVLLSTNLARTFYGLTNDEIISVFAKFRPHEISAFSYEILEVNRSITVEICKKYNCCLYGGHLQLYLDPSIDSFKQPFHYNQHIKPMLLKKHPFENWTTESCKAFIRINDDWPLEYRNFAIKCLEETDIERRIVLCVLDDTIDDKNFLLDWNRIANNSRNLILYLKGRGSVETIPTMRSIYLVETLRNATLADKPFTDYEILRERLAYVFSVDVKLLMVFLFLRMSDSELVTIIWEIVSPREFWDFISKSHEKLRYEDLNTGMSRFRATPAGRQFMLDLSKVSADEKESS